MGSDGDRAKTGIRPWHLYVSGVLAYAGFGLVVRHIPNPMIPSAILALNMVVIVIVGRFGGPRAGALVGFTGTLLNFLVRSALFGWDDFELAAVLPHTAMGAAAGWVGCRGTRIATASTILIGHGLNLSVFLAAGLLDARRLADISFWNGLLAEVTVDVIIIAVVIGVIEDIRSGAWQRMPTGMSRRPLLLASACIGLLVVVLAALFLLGVTFAPYLFFIPVVLAAILLGSYGAWLVALLLSAILGGVVSRVGLDNLPHGVALILTFNLVALAVGELAQNLITHQRLAQQRLIELQETYAALAEADRLKSEMIQNISHELRTPLAIIMGYAELLSTDALGELAPVQRDSATAIYRYGRRLAYLVEQVTVLQQVEEGHLSWQAVPLELVAEAQVSRHLFKAEERGCHLSLLVDGKIPSPEGDVEYLARVVEALLDNAIKFSPNGGDIQVKVWCDQDKAYVSVMDHGIGIAADQQQRIFERFYQVDGSTTREFGGLGTGLALVKEVVQGHGGDIWMESAPGRGSTFGFWLPLTPPAGRRRMESLSYQGLSAG